MIFFAKHLHRIWKKVINDSWFWNIEPKKKLEKSVCKNNWAVSILLLQNLRCLRFVGSSKRPKVYPKIFQPTCVRFASASRSLPVSWGDSWLRCYWVRCERCHGAMIHRPNKTGFNLKQIEHDYRIWIHHKIRAGLILNLLHSLKLTVLTWT